MESYNVALTEQQKAANKAANSAKRRAHHARYKMMKEAIDAAEQSAEVLGAKEKAEQEKQKARVLIQQRADRLAELGRQIIEIQEQISKINREASSCPQIQAERDAWAHWYEIKREKVLQVERQFPDMAGNAKWAFSSWTPPEEIAREIESARLTALAQK